MCDLYLTEDEILVEYEETLIKEFNNTIIDNEFRNAKIVLDNLVGYNSFNEIINGTAKRKNNIIAVLAGNR